jgi:hypothetical protein
LQIDSSRLAWHDRFGKQGFLDLRDPCPIMFVYSH